MTPYHIALTMIPRLGNRGIRKLAEILPRVEEVFGQPHSQLVEIFGKHADIIGAIEGRTTLAAAEKAARELEGKGIKALFFTDDAFPQRMNRPGCDDCPALLYMLGECDLNPAHSVAVVGTRKATPYGLTTTSRLVEELAGEKTMIVSGLAYGIDTSAHTAALACGLPTVGVLGHGLDRIYPPENRDLASRMAATGGALVTEYPLGTAIDRKNFPARNRIIAAMSDATLVVEAAEHGGALITANMALGYSREVFAVPGNIDAPYSIGCNTLITNNKATLVRNAGDIYYQMGWGRYKNGLPNAGKQQEMFAEMSPDEKRLADLLVLHREMTLDEMANLSGMPMQKTAALVFSMETRMIIQCLPGRIYKLV